MFTTCIVTGRANSCACFIVFNSTLVTTPLLCQQVVIMALRELQQVLSNNTDAISHMLSSGDVPAIIAKLVCALLRVCRPRTRQGVVRQEQEHRRQLHQSCAVCLGLVGALDPGRYPSLQVSDVQISAYPIAMLCCLLTSRRLFFNYPSAFVAACFVISFLPPFPPSSLLLLPTCTSVSLTSV